MPGWRVEAADPSKAPALLVFFYSAEDVKSFVDGIVRPNAEKFGLDVTVKQREPKLIETMKV